VSRDTCVIKVRTPLIYQNPQRLIRKDSVARSPERSDFFLVVEYHNA
jgi:hypothetical protein